MKIKIYKNSNIIFGVQFKKIEILIDCDSYVFLGNIKSDEIGINKKIGSILLKKFKILHWDSYNKNLVHIKFLVKYSPVFSKFIDDEELNKIELEELQRISHNPYYLKFEGKFYFHFLTSNCKNKRIVIPMDKDFKNIKVLKNFFKEVTSWRLN